MSVDLSKATEILNKLKADREKREAGGSNIKWTKVEVGENCFRILPPWAGSNMPFREVTYHYLKVGGNDKSIVCPKMNARQECPVCEMFETLRGSSKQEEKDLGWTMRPQSRWFINVIDRKKESEGPKVLGISSKGLMESILRLFADPDYGDISDISKGTDIIIERTGTGLATKYNCHGKRNSSVLGTQDQVNAWYPQIKNLDELAKPDTYDNIVSIMSGEELVENQEPENQTSQQAPLVAPVSAPVSAPAPVAAPQVAPVAPVVAPPAVSAPAPVAPAVNQAASPVTTPQVQQPVTPAVPAGNSQTLADVKARIAALKSKNTAVKV